MACLEITDRIFTDNELIDLYKSTKDSYFLLELYNKNIRLLNKLAWKYSNINYLYTYEDLQNETYLALTEAAEKYDPRMCQFSTFLFVVTNQKLYAVVNGKSSKEKGNNELNKCISIYQTLTNTDDCTIEDMIEDITAENDFNLPERLFILDLHDKLDNALNSLTDKQKIVIECINGFNMESFTEAELASDMHVTPGRINEIKNNAYRKLRGNKELRKIFFEEFRS